MCHHCNQSAPHAALDSKQKHCTLHVMQVVQGTGQELTQGPVFDKWWACDTVTYAITFKTDTGESPRKVRPTPAEVFAMLHVPTAPAASDG
jgi:hypothetical protein